MTLHTHPITGGILSLDEEQRIQAIVTAIGPDATVVLLGAADAVRTAILAAGISEHDTTRPADSAAVTFVAIAAPNSTLGEQDAETVVAHVLAGGEAILDTTPSDTAETDVRNVASAGFAAALQTVGTVALLTSEDHIFEPNVQLAGEVGEPARALARRSLVFAGDGVASRAPQTGAPSPLAFTPTALGEIGRLRAAVRELELANRRLAEGRLGLHDAAASRAAAAVTEVGILRAQLAQSEIDLASATFHAKQNDELFQDARVQLYARVDRVSQLETALAKRRVPVRVSRVGRKVLGRLTGSR